MSYHVQVKMISLPCFIKVLEMKHLSVEFQYKIDTFKAVTDI